MGPDEPLFSALLRSMIPGDDPPIVAHTGQPRVLGRIFGDPLEKLKAQIVDNKISFIWILAAA